MTGLNGIGAGVYAELDGTSRAASQARALVRDLLGNEHPSAQEATLVMSELVSNAITHSQSGRPGGIVTVAVEMTAKQGDVRIRVRDAGGPDAPVLTSSDPDSEHGRGLAIVDALAADWGSRTGPAGRVTWCRIEASRRAAAKADRVQEREAG